MVGDGAQRIGGDGAAAMPGVPQLLCDIWRHGSVLRVGVFQGGDKISHDAAKLGFVTAHQNGVLQSVLGELADLFKVLIEHLDLLATGQRFACWIKPGGGA